MKAAPPFQIRIYKEEISNSLLEHKIEIEKKLILPKNITD